MESIRGISVQKYVRGMYDHWVPKIEGARLPDTQKQTNHSQACKKNTHHGKERPDKNGDGDALYSMISIRTKQTIA